MAPLHWSECGVCVRTHLIPPLHTLTNTLVPCQHDKNNSRPGKFGRDVKCSLESFSYKKRGVISSGTQKSNTLTWQQRVCLGWLIELRTLGGPLFLSLRTPTNLSVPHQHDIKSKLDHRMFGRGVISGEHKKVTC